MHDSTFHANILYGSKLERIIGGGGSVLRQEIGINTAGLNLSFVVQVGVLPSLSTHAQLHATARQSAELALARVGSGVGAERSR